MKRIEVGKIIWFFLAGMIAGAVGVLMYAKYWVETHVEIIKKEIITDDGDGVQRGGGNPQERSVEDGGKPGEV